MKKSALKYLVGIVVCEVSLLLYWINIAPDADVSQFDSVKTLLNSSQASQRPETLLASSAIHHASQYIHTMSIIVLSTSLIVIILSFLVGFQVIKNRDNKS
jgi:hypothetical protein